MDDERICAQQIKVSFKEQDSKLCYMKHHSILHVCCQHSRISGEAACVGGIFELNPSACEFVYSSNQN